MEETELILLDFVLQDVGSHTYTEYSLDGDAAAYYAEHIDELLGAKIAILHSHCSFNAFFSGTDMSTLNEQASQCNNVLSIVVNNEGSYVAKFTERHSVHSHNDITINTTKTDKWKYMGETPDSSTSLSSNAKVEEDDSTEIHIWDCVIDRPLDAPIDDEFKQECISKQSLFAKRKEEKKVNTNPDYEWPSLFDVGHTKPYSNNRSVSTMVYSIVNLSFSNNYYPSNVLSDNLSFDFIDAFMDAWYEFFRPTKEQLEEVYAEFLHITFNEHSYPEVKEFIIEIFLELLQSNKFDD